MDLDAIREPKTFQTPTGGYTPDFYLPDLDLFVEVKGISHPKQEEKMRFVSSLVNLRVIRGSGKKGAITPAFSAEVAKLILLRNPHLSGQR